MNTDLSTALAADLHAAQTIWVERTEIVGDAEFAMRQISEACIANRWNLALLGDMTDRVDKSSVSMVQSEIESVLDAGLDVGYIAGNHDRESWVATTRSMVDRIHHLTDCNWMVGDHHVVGLDYIRPGDRDQLQARINIIGDAYDIVALHQSVKPAYRFNNFDCDLDQFPAHIKQVWCGHLHVMSDTPGADGRRMLIPGCPYLHRIDEHDRHGMWIVAPDLTVTCHEVRSRPILRMEILQREQIDQILEAARTGRDLFLKDTKGVGGITTNLSLEVSKPIILLRYDPKKLPGIADDVADQLRGEAHMIGLPVDSESGQVVQTLAVQAISVPQASMMEDCLDELVDPVKEPIPHKYLAMSLRGVPHQDVVREAAAEAGIPSDLVEEMIRKGPR